MKISICMITYNHADFIAEAIKSVLMQETEYDYELIIGEDHSPDNTRQICEQYQAQYPDRIKVLPDTGHNLGAMQNYIRTISACDGEFLAILEGDDYWTHPQKLQMQVDFLRDNPEYVACFTDHDVITSGETTTKTEEFLRNTDDDTLTLDRLLRGNQIATCTILYRNKLRGYPIEWMTTLEMGDWPTHLLHAQYGDFKYLPLKTGTYRLHESNYYAGRDFIDRMLVELDVLEAMKTHLPPLVHKRIEQQLRWRYISLAKESYKLSQWWNTTKYIVKATKHKSTSSWLETLGIKNKRDSI